MYHNVYLLSEICTHFHHFVRRLIHYFKALLHLYRINMEVLSLQTFYENIYYVLYLCQIVIAWQFEINLIY